MKKNQDHNCAKAKNQKYFNVYGERLLFYYGVQSELLVSNHRCKYTGKYVVACSAQPKLPQNASNNVQITFLLQLAIWQPISL